MNKRYYKPFLHLIWGLLFLVTIYTPAIAQETYTDADGNVYQTVTIGDRVWLTQNLKVKTFNNGDPIPFIKTDSAWAADSRDSSQPGYAIFRNDSTLIDTFGYLYNHFVITDSRGITADGWRVPTEDDWKALETFAGMPEADLDRNGWAGAAENVAGKLQSTSETHWDVNENATLTNETGFNWTGGSNRYAYGAFEGPASILRLSTIWSADEDESNSSNAWRRLVRFDRSDVRRHPVPKGTGMSIRLVKDANATSNEAEFDQPKEIKLDQNYPNPFNPSTNISFNLPQASDVTLTVYNMLGKKVAVLVNGQKSAGAHSVTFDASGLSSGVYMYRLQTNSVTITKMMTLLK
ncbi:MAG: T9SS type A sorting domain-containing protein [Balneolaceae bacterium]|nr:T9SS type A sorting domain-containing protein [Balneolaceae bacterium]